MKDSVAYKVEIEKGKVNPQAIEDLLCDLPIGFHLYNQLDTFLYVHLSPDQSTEEVVSTLKKLGVKVTGVSVVK